MKVVSAIGLLVLGLSSVAQADIIRCHFTEPFISTEYSMAQQSLTITGMDLPKKVLKNVSFQIKGAGEFELVKNQKVIQKLTLSNEGSDGMSDTKYPFEVKWVTSESMANNGVGGCTSNYLKSTNADN